MSSPGFMWQIGSISWSHQATSALVSLSPPSLFCKNCFGWLTKMHVLTVSDWSSGQLRAYTHGEYTRMGMSRCLVKSYLDSDWFSVRNRLITYFSRLGNQVCCYRLCAGWFRVQLWTALSADKFLHLITVWTCYEYDSSMFVNSVRLSLCFATKEEI